jgi:hypothetical protein
MNHFVPKRESEGDPEKIFSFVSPFNHARPNTIKKFRERQHSGMNCNCDAMRTLAGHLPVIYDLISKFEEFTSRNPVASNHICPNSRERPQAVISVSNALQSVEECQTVIRTTPGATLPSARVASHRNTGDM